LKLLLQNAGNMHSVTAIQESRASIAVAFAFSGSGMVQIDPKSLTIRDKMLISPNHSLTASKIPM
jgi:hypothetical protein